MSDPFAKRGRGRPRRAPDAMPVFMRSWPDRRVAVRVVISGFAVAELRRYVEWASEPLKLDATEVLYRTLDAAILDITRRDRLWRKHRRGFVNRDAGAKDLGTEPVAPGWLDEEPTLVTPKP